MQESSSFSEIISQYIPFVGYNCELECVWLYIFIGFVVGSISVSYYIIVPTEEERRRPEFRSYSTLSRLSILRARLENRRPRNWCRRGGIQGMNTLNSSNIITYDDDATTAPSGASDLMRSSRQGSSRIIPSDGHSSVSQDPTIAPSGISEDPVSGRSGISDDPISVPSVSSEDALEVAVTTSHEGVGPTKAVKGIFKKSVPAMRKPQSTVSFQQTYKLSPEIEKEPQSTASI